VFAVVQFASGTAGFTGSLMLTVCTCLDFLLKKRKSLSFKGGGNILVCFSACEKWQAYQRQSF
jgi:hypothetical protein